MKVYFLWASTKPSLDHLLAALAFSMPRSLVLPLSQDWVRCACSLHAKVQQTAMLVATIGSLVLWECLGLADTKQIRSFSSIMLQNWVICFLVWLSPCRSQDWGCYWVVLHSPCQSPTMLFGQDWVICLVGLLSPCQGPAMLFGHQLCVGLAVSIPRPLVLPPSQDWVNGFVVSLPRSNTQQATYTAVVPLCFHQAQTGSVCWSGCLHAEVPCTSTRPKTGSGAWWACCLHAKVRKSFHQAKT